MFHRGEQVSRAQADLAAAAAEVSKLHSLRAISNQRITLPIAVDGEQSMSPAALEKSTGQSSENSVMPGEQTIMRHICLDGT